MKVAYKGGTAVEDPYIKVFWFGRLLGSGSVKAPEQRRKLGGWRVMLEGLLVGAWGPRDRGWSMKTPLRSETGRQLETCLEEWQDCTAPFGVDDDLWTGG